MFLSGTVFVSSAGAVLSRLPSDRHQTHAQAHTEPEPGRGGGSCVDPAFILIIIVRFSVDVCVTDICIGHLWKYRTNHIPYWFNTGLNI